jgi:hypothetical protein
MHGRPHPNRFAWWISFLATLALLSVLWAARSAQAATLPIGEPVNALPPLSLAADPEEEDEELEEEELEVEECEEEEGDEEECEARIAADEGDDPCILRSAEATVSVLKAHDKVRLALRYTAEAPAVVSVEYGLRGRRGALKMGEETRRFGRSGVFRATETLTEAEMKKVNAAKEFDVRLHAVNTPRFCRSVFDRDLTARHGSAHGPVWTD